MKEKLLSIGRNGALNPENGRRFIYVYGITESRMDRIVHGDQYIVGKIVSEVKNYYAPYVTDMNGNKKYLFLEKLNDEVVFLNKPYYYIDEMIIKSDEKCWLDYIYSNFNKLKNKELYSDIKYDIIDYNKIYKNFTCINY